MAQEIKNSGLFWLVIFVIVLIAVAIVTSWVNIERKAGTVSGAGEPESERLLEIEEVEHPFLGTIEQVGLDMVV